MSMRTHGYFALACCAAAFCSAGLGCTSDASDASDASDESSERLDCTSQADCDSDARCVGVAIAANITVPGTCQPRLAVGQLDDAVAGRACMRDLDCSGGQCAEQTPLGTPFPDRYCTGRCYEDAQCGASAACVAPQGLREPGHCFQTCARDVDCERDHYRCRELGDGMRVVRVCYPGEDPLPDRSVGLSCAGGSDCAVGATCRDSLPLLALLIGEALPAQGGYCTAECLLDEDCGGGAQCLSGGPSGGLCFASCDDDAPCRAGYDCEAHLRDGDPEQRVCLPRWSSQDDAGF